MTIPNKMIATLSAILLAGGGLVACSATEPLPVPVPEETQATQGAETTEVPEPTQEPEQPAEQHPQAGESPQRDERPAAARDLTAVAQAASGFFTAYMNATTRFDSSTERAYEVAGEDHAAFFDALEISKYITTAKLTAQEEAYFLEAMWHNFVSDLVIDPVHPMEWNIEFSRKAVTIYNDDSAFVIFERALVSIDGAEPEEGLEAFGGSQVNMHFDVDRWYVEAGSFAELMGIPLDGSVVEGG